MSATTDLPALREDLDRLAEKYRAIDLDVGLQLSQMQTLIRTERKVADDRYETLNRKLDEVLKRLGTNGSGGGDG